MIRRILAGAVTAGFALGLFAGAASADVGPNVSNTGQNILSQNSIIEDIGVVQDVLNDSVKNNDILTVAHLEDVDLQAFNEEPGCCGYKR